MKYHRAVLPHKVKQYVHFSLHANCFLLSWKILEEISRWSITKGSTNRIKYMSIQSFTMAVDLPEIGCYQTHSNSLKVSIYQVCCCIICNKSSLSKPNFKLKSYWLLHGFKTEPVSFSKLMMLLWSTRLAGNNVITSWWDKTGNKY